MLFRLFTVSRHGNWEFILSLPLVRYLHDCTLALGCMPIAEWLLEVLKQAMTSLELPFESIVVVTGKGLGSGAEGPVLRPGVPHFLRKTFGPEISPDEKNEGAFFLTCLSLQKWVDSDAVEKFKSRFTCEVGRQSLSDQPDD